MVKLCLGSANFGTRYGLENKKVNKNKALNIIKTASKSKIYTIDTSFEYSNSHDQLKKLSNKKMNIISKIFLNRHSSFISIKKKIEDFNKYSPSKINSLLFHNQNEALVIRNINLLKKLKKEGIINYIGVSVYDCDVLKNILKIWTPDIVQIPVNPFNRDFISENFLSNLKKKRITIFARSIFLKSILIKKSNKLAYKFTKDLDDWFEFCNLKSINPVKACIDFCKSITEIDYIIVGVQDEEELKEIIKYFRQPKNRNINLISKKNYKKIDLRKV